MAKKTINHSDHRIQWPAGGFWIGVQDGQPHSWSGQVRAFCESCEEMVWLSPTPSTPAQDFPKPTMLKVAGKRYVCPDCGSNVQTQFDEHTWKCNGCENEMTDLDDEDWKNWQSRASTPAQEGEWRYDSDHHVIRGNGQVLYDVLDAWYTAIKPLQSENTDLRKRWEHAVEGGARSIQLANERADGFWEERRQLSRELTDLRTRLSQATAALEKVPTIVAYAQALEKKLTPWAISRRLAMPDAQEASDARVACYDALAAIKAGEKEVAGG